MTEEQLNKALAIKKKIDEAKETYNWLRNSIPPARLVKKPNGNFVIRCFRAWAMRDASGVDGFDEEIPPGLLKELEEMFRKRILQFEKELKDL